MIVDFSIKATENDIVEIPDSVSFNVENAVGAFAFVVEKGGSSGHSSSGHSSGGFVGSEVEALILIDKMHDVIDEIVSSSNNLKFAYLKLLEHRMKAKDIPEDSLLKVQLDLDGIREQLKKDREEWPNAE